MSSGRRAADAETPTKLDLTRLENLGGPEAETLSRYVRMIQVQRQDFNGRVLTIRRDDMRAIAAILGGALGNFTDRFYGTTPGVVDFIDVRFGNFRWFIFNIADAFICVGAFLLAIAFYKFEKAEKEARRAEEAQGENKV